MPNIRPGGRPSVDLRVIVAIAVLGFGYAPAPAFAQEDAFSLDDLFDEAAEHPPAKPANEATEPQDPAPSSEPQTAVPAGLDTIPVESADDARPADTVRPRTLRAVVEEIVVTAQRRVQNLQATPVAVTALSAEALEERNIQTTQDLMQVTPSLQVSTATAGGGGSAVFFLRGMGQQRSGNGTEPAVGVYVDGVYYPSIQGSIFNIVDFQQVEVLRGPQGTLFGRNTIGGAIRYTSRDPVFENQGYLTATGGSFGRQDFSGAVNLAPGDTLAMRFTGGTLHRDGFVRQQDGGDDAALMESDVLRAQFLFTPTDTFEVKLTGQHTKSLIDGFPYNQPGPIEPEFNTIPWFYNLAATGNLLYPRYDDQFASQCQYCQAGTNAREYSETVSDAAHLSLRWHGLAFVDVQSLTAWQKVETDFVIDVDGSPAPILLSGARFYEEIVSQELQFSGDGFGQKLDWVGGIYVAEQTFDLVPNEDLLFDLITQRSFPVLRATTTLAAFIDASYRLGESTTLLAGYRYSEDDKDAQILDSDGETVDDSDQRSFRSTTGRLGLQYQWTDDIMSYASVSSGFRAGGFNVEVSTPLVFAPPLYERSLSSYKPETVISYELGMRADFLGGALRFNPTVFYAQWKDIQVQSVNVDASALEIFVDNAAKAHSAGLELEFHAALSEHILLFGNCALLEMQYDEIGNATGITTDSEFMRAPKVTYTIGGSYRNTVEGWFKYALTANWNWQDDQASSATDVDSLPLKSYGLLSLRLDIRSPEERLELSLFGTNVTDADYFVGGTDFTASAGTARYDLGRPREFGASLKYNF
ncbi:MAG: TonB-dependent receptor [Pseudomonadota bacterium]|nr:TonB-dependent receptor [Pseudomonadota bacterium]